MTATSVSISAQTLIELGQLQSREGTVILGAVVIDDVMGIIALSLVVALARADLDMLVVVARLALYFGLAIFAARAFAPLFRWGDRLGVSQGLLALVVVIAFTYAATAEWLGGVAAITGSYLAGVLVAQTPFRARVDAGIHPLTYSLIVPVFFIGIGLRANARELGSQVALTVSLILVAIVAKAVGCGSFARVCGFTNRESLRVGVGMISRGEVGLIVAGYGLTHGLIARDVFSGSVLMVLVTTMVTPPLLRLVFPHARKSAHGILEETIAGPPEEGDAAR
jgi:Kef-type K+ transport system membrane component KefB